MKQLLKILFCMQMLLASAFVCAQEAGKKPDIKRFVVISPAPLNTYTFDNRSVGSFIFKNFFPLGVVGSAMNARDVSAAEALTASLKARGLALETLLVAQVQLELAKVGFASSVLNVAKRSEKWPDWFEYEKISHDGDAILHLVFGPVGVFSAKDSPRFQPMIEVNATVVLKGKDSKHVSEGVYFGHNASEDDRELSTIRSLSSSFANAEDVMKNIPKLDSLFKQAIPKLAKRLAEQLHDSLL